MGEATSLKKEKGGETVKAIHRGDDVTYLAFACINEIYNCTSLTPQILDPTDTFWDRIGMKVQ